MPFQVTALLRALTKSRPYGSEIALLCGVVGISHLLDVFNLQLPPLGLQVFRLQFPLLRLWVLRRFFVSGGYRIPTTVGAVACGQHDRADEDHTE